jgi:hypothetical protein
MHHMKIWIAILLGLALAGCTTGIPGYVKAYRGDDLPKEQLALVKPIVGIIVRSVDGETTLAPKPNNALGFPDIEIALPAGRHRMDLDYAWNGLQNRRTVTVYLDARPGRKYLLTYDNASYTTGWNPRFEDVTDAPERWCAMAGPQAIRQCRNEGDRKG